MDIEKRIREIIKEVFESSIKEDIVAQDGAVKFDYDSKEKVRNINTSLGKSSKNVKFTPRVSTLSNSRVKVVSAYSKNSGSDVTDILKSIKKAKDGKFEIDDLDYDMFLSRTAIFFARYLKDKKIDSILVMESSSPLASDIAKKIKGMLPDTSISFLANSVVKNIDNLTLDKSEDDKISQSELDGLKKLYDRAKETGEFSIKKIHPRHRKYFTNWIKVNEEAIKKITNKNVILFDDYITSGATLDEACREILKLSPESLSVITLIK